MFDTSANGIISLIARGETPSVEFKRFAFSTEGIRRYANRFAHTVGGGIILFGVDNSGAIVGLNRREEEVALDRCQRAASAVLNPKEFRVGVVSLESKRVVFLEVQKLARYRNSKFLAFLIETTLVLTIYSCVWYLAWLPATEGKFIWIVIRAWYLRFSIPALFWTNLTLFMFLALVFYGTAFEVTPIKIVATIFSPFVALYRSRQRRDALRKEAEVGAGDETSLTDKENETDEENAGTQLELKPPEKQEPATDKHAPEVVVVDAEYSLFEKLGARASFFSNRMEKRTNTYLILGVGMGFAGMSFWFWTFSNTFTKQLSFIEFIETALPRITILLFIELLAGFFLRQYRIGVEDFKYFFEIEQKANLKQISHAILVRMKNEPGLLTLASILSNDAGPMKLASGESTPTLEALKAEGNVALEAMKVLSTTIQEVAKSIKPRS